MIASKLKEAVSFEKLNIEALKPNNKEKFSSLLINDEFRKAKTFREQVKIALIMLRPEDERFKVTFEEFGIFFNCSSASIYKQYLRLKKDTLPNGRPPILCCEAIEFIKNIIRDNFLNNSPVTYDFLLDAIQYRFSISLKPDTLRHICRGIDEVKTVRGIPMEQQRVSASNDDIMKYYDLLNAMIQQIPGSFIFNVDESGCCDWTDAHEVKVLVPQWYEDSNIKIPVDRNSMRATIVGCIAADGTCMKPLVLLPRKTIDSDLILYGYNDNQALFVYQKNAFMTTKLFEKWAIDVFFPDIEKRRKKYDYEGPAVLILDGLGSHYSDTFLEACNIYNVYVLFLVPHTSDQCQPLDLVTFSLLKRAYSKMTFDKFASKQSNQVIKMLGAWYQATAPHLIISAFVASGMNPYLNNNQIYWNVDLRKASQLRLLRSTQREINIIDEYSRIRIDE